jgi:hypothetical protein
MEVLLGYPVPLVRLGDGAVTREHGERHSNIFPQKVPHFLPPVHVFEYGEVQIRISAIAKLDVDVHTTQTCRFHFRALREPDVKEVVPQVKVGVNPHECLAQSHNGRDMQDPRGS